VVSEGEKHEGWTEVKCERHLHVYIEGSNRSMLDSVKDTWGYGNRFSRLMVSEGRLQGRS
jgi:hypothetical protein